MNARPGEFELIAQLFAPLTRGAPAALGLKDDAALIRMAAEDELVVTTDGLVEGVHFLAGDPAHTIAQKALRVNLSDLAAKGAEPVGYFLTLMLPSERPFAWIRDFASGLAADGEQFGLPLLGGDTTATPGPFALSVTALGRVPRGGMIQRAGARAGDLVFVSGTLGDAGAGLELARAAMPEPAELVARYRIPEPRLGLGQALRGLATAGLDVSDGLIADLGHIAEVSGVAIVVDAERLPLSRAIRALWGSDAPLRAAVCGDDYELAFTVATANRLEVLERARASGTVVSEIGRVEAGSGVRLLAAGRQLPLAKGGWTHF
ncbi:MAG: thiamine-phosphate kinase [Alphaproteobacteria bacterium]|nr:thiamine-phosphate kinase [Alphaproteobacteria bacterium]